MDHSVHDEEESLLERVGGILAKEPRLIRLPLKGRWSLSGYHGDLDATKQVIHQYLRGLTASSSWETTSIGERSQENIRYLLQTKWELG